MNTQINKPKRERINKMDDKELETPQEAYEALMKLKAQQHKKLTPEESCKRMIKQKAEHTHKMEELSLNLEVDEDVNHPAHYNQHPAGIECIEIVRYMGFDLGNAMKYIWRASFRSDNPEQDLRKAIWYLNDELQLLEAERIKLEAERAKDEK